jgi:hypothetical protein
LVKAVEQWFVSAISNQTYQREALLIGAWNTSPKYQPAYQHQNPFFSGSKVTHQSGQN